MLELEKPCLAVATGEIGWCAEVSKYCSDVEEVSIGGIPPITLATTFPVRVLLGKSSASPFAFGIVLVILALVSSHQSCAQRMRHQSTASG